LKSEIFWKEVVLFFVGAITWCFFIRLFMNFGSSFLGSIFCIVSPACWDKCYKVINLCEGMKKKVIAFDIGGTSIRCGLVRGKKILKFVSCETPKVRKAFLEKIVEFSEGFMSEDVAGIGIGFPSPVREGVVKNPPNVKLKNFDLKSYLEKKFDVRVEIANDVDCVALAELKIGIKRRNFFVIALGTGIGGGVVVDGELYHGGSGYGSELGHIIIDGKDFESLWKGTKRKIEREFGKGMLVRDLVKMKDKKADAILMEASDYLGEGIASVISVLDSEVVILGGGVRDSGKRFLKMVNLSVGKYSFLPKTVKVVFGKIDSPGVLGASLLID
jgi:glucokinase